MSDTVTTTYLEMLASPMPGRQPAPPEGVSVRRVACPPVAFYRFLYDAVGGPWQWVDRRSMSDEALREIVQDPDVHVHVLYVGEAAAGYVELDYRRPPDAEVAYFGLMPDFIGRGLGRFFLEWAVHEAWRHQPGRLWVHTCTLDHPRALPLYQAVGFIICRVEQHDT